MRTATFNSTGYLGLIDGFYGLAAASMIDDAECGRSDVMIVPAVDYKPEPSLHIWATVEDDIGNCYCVVDHN